MIDKVFVYPAKSDKKRMIGLEFDFFWRPHDAATHHHCRSWKITKLLLDIHTHKNSQPITTSSYQIPCFVKQKSLQISAVKIKYQMFSFIVLLKNRMHSICIRYKQKYLRCLCWILNFSSKQNGFARSQQDNKGTVGGEVFGRGWHAHGHHHQA